MILGGKIERIMTASAPISAEVLSFIRVAFCVDISEAYGQTEGKQRKCLLPLFFLVGLGMRMVNICSFFMFSSD